MDKIQMVDLRKQYDKIKPEVDRAIASVIENTAFVKGPDVQLFQDNLAKYLNVKHVIGCANGTDALQVAMMALDLKPGDEVITSNFTFIATVEVIKLLGLVPVLVDVDPRSFNLSPDAVLGAITSKTKAIVPVHIFGQSADMDSIMEIARKHNLFVIEDNAQAIGSDYYFDNGTSAKAGTIGDIGCTSFFPSKNLGCYGDGGALFTNNDELAAKITSIVNHGMTRRYYHDHVGVNSRLDTIQAAILKIKLEHLEDYIAERKKAAAFYNRKFENIPQITIPYEEKFTSHVFHQYTLKLKGVNRDGLLDYLIENGIPCAVYYPVPLHMQKAYLDSRYQEGDFPVTEELCRTVISLPMHTELDSEQLEFITDKVISYISKQ